jgi:hypothetical protein
LGVVGNGPIPLLETMPLFSPQHQKQPRSLFATGFEQNSPPSPNDCYAAYFGQKQQQHQHVPPHQFIHSNSNSCDENELRLYHKHLELQQHIYEHVYAQMLTAATTGGGNHQQKSQQVRKIGGTLRDTLFHPFIVHT